MYKQRIVTRLKAARLERGRLQVDIATAAGVNQGRLSLMENGWVRPTPRQLRRIATALGVEPNLLAEPLPAMRARETTS